MQTSGSPKRMPLAKAIALLMDGGVGVIPTDTIYGLVARAADPAAVARLYQLKSRDHKPGTVIAASTDQLADLGVPKRYVKAVAQFWPNPLSIVLPVGSELGYLTQDVHSLAVRVPKSESIRNLLEQTGPLVTSSANQPGEQPAENITAAESCFGEDVDFYVDGGYLPNDNPSTVIRVVDDAIEVLRIGALKLDENGYPINDTGN